MIGVIERAIRGLQTLSEVAQHPKSLLSENLSPKTQVALRVANLLVFPETSERDPELYRLLSNFIYYSNNFFDIGLRAYQHLSKNRPAQFLTLLAVYEQTKAQMNQAAFALLDKKPGVTKIVTNFINDGSLIVECQDKLG